MYPVSEGIYINFMKTHIDAKIPTKGTENSAGFDLYACEKINIKARSHNIVQTGIAMKICNLDIMNISYFSVYGRIAPRSGLALKFGIDVGAGVIDNDYRGSIGVILFNHNDIDYNIEIGDRIAQLIPTLYLNISAHEVFSLDQTTRGNSGFGSTGK